MKATTAAAIINSVMWVSVGAAIIVALILTGRLAVLWFFLLPGVCGVSTGKNKKDADDEHDKD